MEYCERSWGYELPDRLEFAIENDYVQNKSLYTEEVFKVIPFLFELQPEITANEMLDFVRRVNET
jgi:hypothetical protein